MDLIRLDLVVRRLLQDRVLCRRPLLLLSAFRPLCLRLASLRLLPTFNSTNLGCQF